MGWPARVNLRALASRFRSAEASSTACPATNTSSVVCSFTSPVRDGKRRNNSAVVSRVSSARSTGANSTSAPIREASVRRRNSNASTNSLMACTWLDAFTSPCRWRSGNVGIASAYSISPATTVSGVRSSCAASWVKCCSAFSISSSRASSRLNEADRFVISSGSVASPSAATEPVSDARCATSAIRDSGRSARRAMARLAIAAMISTGTPDRSSAMPSAATASACGRLEIAAKTQPPLGTGTRTSRRSPGGGAEPKGVLEAISRPCASSTRTITPEAGSSSSSARAPLARSPSSCHSRSTPAAIRRAVSSRYLASCRSSV